VTCVPVLILELNKTNPEKYMANIERDRDLCFQILSEFTKSESLIKHALAVETCVRAYAEKLNQDTDFWGNVALLHDFDYEMYPSSDGHPFKGNEILRERGFSEEFRNAIMSHADYTGIKRTSQLEKVLFACDELAGFITAVTYVRPSRTIDEVEVKSVLKKMKDKAFARTVNRDDIIKGAQEMAVPLEEHIQYCIDSMKNKKDLLGL
jgi:putative nucleotidyltransferase with HDIG domain